MRRRCLVHVFHPGNMLAALAAVQWYGHSRLGNTATEVTTIIHTPGLPMDKAEQGAAVISRMVGAFGWPAPILLTDADLARISPSKRFASYRAVLRRFRRCIGVSRVDEVYYTHDIVGGIAELAMNAFPNARHVTFGDALGSVYDKELHLGMASGKNRKDLAMARHTPGPPKSLASSVKRALKTCVLGRPKPLQATKAVLVLPMDQTGQCLRDKKLLVVPKNIVERLLRQCERALPELSDYTASLLDSTPQPRFLLMLENFADGSFTTLEHEASLCEDIVRRHVPGGATVVLKAHPLAVAQLDKTLAARLSADYTVRCVSPAYSRYPMELWGDLVRSCQVISFSYCSISLTFLYDKAVIYPMTDALIERYIPSRFWDSYKNADALYQGQLRNLAAWDGQSVLWRGECP